MRIGDVLKTRGAVELWSIRPDRPLFELAESLHDRQVGALTVLDAAGALVGVVSERDLVAAMAARREEFAALSVRDVMSRTVTVCAPGDDMMETLETMNRQRIRHIPVMEGERAITMISIREFDAACKELQHLASTDTLTGLPNRRQFMQTMDKEINRHRRFRAPLSVAMLDIDHFKSVNDIYGHDAGDEVLKALAGLLTRDLRTYDGIGRLGGEEFALLFPNTELQCAETACKRLIDRVRGHSVDTSAGVVRFTVSLGLTVIRGDAVTGREILKTADEFLYKAKSGGRDQVVTGPMFRENAKCEQVA